MSNTDPKTNLEKLRNIMRYLKIDEELFYLNVFKD